MSPLKVATVDGGERVSKGKVAGLILQVVGGWAMAVPILNHLFHWHLPTPVTGIEDQAAALIDQVADVIRGVIVFAAGLGIHSIRSNQ